MPERTELVDRETGQSAEIDDRPILVLEVLRGATRYPRRPVLTDRFLIGGSPACDLHLGSDNLPPYHSLVVHEDGAYRWETVMPEPAVLHNSKIEDWFELRDGDRVRIGEFELAVHLELIEEVAASAGIQAATRDAADTIAFQDRSVYEMVSKMSAEDLVDRLEREMSAVDHVEQRQKLGAKALLHAARERVASTAPPSRVAATAEDTIDKGIASVGESFNRFAFSMQRALDAIRNGEAAGTELIETALTAHAELAIQLRSLQAEISAEDTREAASQRSAA